MGKSFHNDIKISDDEETTAKKVMMAITDRSRARKTDLGHPDKCEVAFTYYQYFADEQTVQQVKCECEKGERGCADCKRQLGCIINSKFAPIRQKRSEYAKDLDKVKDIINEGGKKAREEAQKNIEKIRDIINL